MNDYLFIAYWHSITVDKLEFAITNYGLIVDPEAFNPSDASHQLAFKTAPEYWSELHPALMLKADWDRQKDSIYHLAGSPIYELPPVYENKLRALEMKEVRKNPFVNIKAMVAEMDECIEWAKSYRPEPKPTFTRKVRAGYVYLVQEPKGTYKIGRALDVQDRMRTFGIKLPYKVDLLAVIQSGDYVATEQELHFKFAEKRVDGEWFALTDEDVAYIKSLAGAS